MFCIIHCFLYKLDYMFDLVLWEILVSDLLDSRLQDSKDPLTSSFHLSFTPCFVVLSPLFLVIFSFFLFYLNLSSTQGETRRKEVIRKVGKIAVKR